VDLTVALCVFNGEKRLPATLVTLAAQQGLAGVLWEVLLIDNRCTDGTVTLFEDFRHRHAEMNCRVVHEETPGAGASRRRAYREAQGRWICCVDDDNLLDPDYLQIGLYFGKQTEAGAFGGNSIGEYEGPEPPYLDNFKPSLAIWEGGPVTREIGAERHFTAGLFLRTAAVREVLSETWLAPGRSPGCPFGGEDRELYIKLSRRGWSYWYVAGLSFRHVMPAGRLRLKSLLRQRFLQGGETVFFKFGYLPAGQSLGIEGFRFILIDGWAKFLARCFLFVFSAGSRRWRQLSEAALRAGVVCCFPKAIREYGSRRREVVTMPPTS
jgi:glycosyltransferase involved in cell wall biosynthesis